MKIQNVKGGYDFLPKEQRIRNYINGILRETFEAYGYLPIETPILCYYDMLSGKYDENNDILKEIYKLTDQGNRSLGLRYDLTVPFAKFIALNKNELKLPFKRYEINKVFRDGPVKVGRDREFTQCDVDVVGLTGSMIEAELLSLYISAFKKLEIPVIIKYNSRKLMSGLIEECGVEKEDISATITIIDKIEKISREEITEELMKKSLNEEQVSNLLNYFTLPLTKLNEIFKDTTNILIKEGLEELNELENYLKFLKIDNLCIFTSSLARGQDYYTGNVFEVYETSGKITSSIGGGGRYDKMITDFIQDGTEYPAVGISFGLTVIYELLKDRVEFNDISEIDVYIIPLNTNEYSLKLAEDLRSLGLKVDIEMTSRKMKKSLDYCNKESIPYVIILGEDEIKNNTCQVKDMFNKNTYEISLDNPESILTFIK